MARFLVDQQLPTALVHHLSSKGHDAKHTKDYPGGTTLPDAEITRIADTEHRIVVTKDEDFRISHLLNRRPAQLLHITCGNSSTRDLLSLINRHYTALEAALNTYSYIELGHAGIIIHDSN